MQKPLYFEVFGLMLRGQDNNDTTQRITGQPSKIVEFFFLSFLNWT